MRTQRGGLRLAAIVFTDIVGYSSLVHRNPSLGARLLDYQRLVVRRAIPRFGGREIETAGDSFLLEFPSALNALAFVAQVQNELARGSEIGQVKLRASIHIGDVEHRGREVFGDGVNVSARLMPLSPEGGVAISDVVEAQVRNRIEVRLNSLGVQKLKNIERPVEVFVLDGVALAAINPAVLPTDSASPWTRWLAPAGGLAVGIVIVALLSWWWTRPGTVAPFAAVDARPLPSKQAIAVLPLKVVGSDSDSSYLASGIHEQILTALANVHGLVVMARSAVMPYADKEVVPADLAVALDVGSMVEGSVEKQGQRVQISLQLIDTQSGAQVWAQRYVRDIDDLFTLQSEVAERVATAVSTTLSDDERAAIDAPPTTVPAAYDVVLRYDALVRQSGQITRENEAEQLLERIIELDPSSSWAWSRLALSYANTYGNTDGSVAVRDKALRAIAEAERLAPDSGHVLAARSIVRYFVESDFAGALSDARRAAARLPNSSLAYAALSRTAEANERIDIMLQAAQHALRLDPRSQLRWFDIAYAYYVSHDYDRAREPTARVIELAPDDAFYRTFEANNTLSFDGDFAAYWARLHAIKPDNNDDRALLMLNLAEQSDAQADEALRFFATMPQWVPSDIGGDMPRDVAQAWLYEKKGDQDAARPHWQRAIAPLEERRRDAPNSVDTALKLAEAYAATGQPDGARRLVNQVLSAPEYRDPSQRGLIAVGLASALIKLGEPSKAIDQLASALERPSDLSPQLLSLERRLQSLHRDPRFAALAHIDTVSGNTLPGG